MEDEIEKFISDDLHLPEQMRHLFIAVREIVGNEKIVVGLSETSHLTIHFGSKSKVFDIHLTDESKSEEKHQTLFKIQHERGLELMKHLADVIMKLLPKVWMARKINLGKLHHHNCVLNKMDEVDDILQGLIVAKKKKVKFGKSFKKSSALQLITTPDSLRKNKKGRIFMVFKVRKGKWLNQGFIWYPPNTFNGKPYFVSNKSFNQMRRLLMQTLLEKCDELEVFIHSDIRQKLSVF
ncbi:MAG: hypothetical protein KA841_00130 [Chitinophagales bacterium]|jgi:hypothetical protein|nr:hypothetical protein [Chitinophagales bacterium]